MKTIILYTLALSLTACEGNRIFRDGKDGTDGKNGSSCTQLELADHSGAIIACSDGTTSFIKNGSKGDKGTTGASCSTTPLPDNSGALISCGDGTSVAVTNGTKGDTGQTGASGQNGTNATPVVAIQLCPNVVSNFPEQAFLIGGKLYAVYSASGKASMALLVPGTYTTTAPGQNCTFTVQPDGVTVTH